MDYSMSAEAVSRFFAKVNQRTPKACHTWLGASHEGRAGTFCIDQRRRAVKPARIAHYLAYGSMPDDLAVIRACGNQMCVNPKHLYLWDRRGGCFEARLLRDIDTRPGQGPRGDCWEWQGSMSSSGYGTISYSAPNARPLNLSAHRSAFLLFHPEIVETDDPFVCHTCDNKKCCNPEHLYAGSPQSNVKDREERQRGYRGPRPIKLTESQVRRIKFKEPGLNIEIAERYGVSKSMVSMIKSGKRWPNLTP